MTSPEEVLSRPQRNALFRVLDKSGAPVSEFRLEAGKLVSAAGGRSDEGVFIRHDASGSYFFIHDSGMGSGTYSISGTIMNGDPAMTWLQGNQAFVRVMGYERPAQRPAKSGSLIGKVLAAGQAMLPPVMMWDQVTPLLEKWAQAVVAGSREYAGTPDLWAEFQESRGLLAGHPANTPFTEAEQAEVCSQIKQVRKFVRTVPELTDDQMSEVNERLDEMEEASRRLGRKDWLMMVYGGVFGLILNDTITPPVAERILMTALQGLGHLFGIGGPPAPLP